MREAAMELRNIAELVLLEAQRMEASQARFAAQKASRSPKQTAEPLVPAVLTNFSILL